MDRNIFLVAGAFATLAPAVVLAQEGQGFSGFVSQTFEGGTNLTRQPGGDSLGGRSLTRVGVGYLSETDTRTFSLDSDILGRGLSIENEIDDFLLTLPSARLLYSAERPDGFLELGAVFRETPIDILRPENEFNEDGEFVGDDSYENVAGVGRRQFFGGTAEARFGEDGPIEFGIDLGVRQIEYLDDQNSEDDTFRAIGEAEALFRITPLWTASVFGGLTYFESDDDVNTRRELYDFGVGLGYAVGPNLRLNSEIGYRYDETRRTTGDSQDDGMFATLGADYTAALWEISLEGGIRDVDNTILPIGRLAAERTLAQGSLFGFVGLETTEDAENVVTGGLSFQYEVAPASTFRAGLDRDLTIGDDGEDQLRTAALLEYAYRIGPRSDGSIGVNYATLESLDTSNFEESYTEFNLGYEYALTPRADLTLGYSYQIEDNPPSDETESHLVSVGITVPFGL